MNFTALFQFALWPYFVGVYCTGIVGILVLTWTTWEMDLSALKKKLQDVDQALTKLQPDLINKYHEDVGKRFPQLWPRYKSVLIPSPDRNGNVATASASQYINDSNVFASHLPVQVYAAMPNILTGLGILGTFLGLAGGIYEATPLITSPSADPSTIREALSQLLSGAALAFVTSIVGILSSMLFLWRFRHGLDVVSGLVTQWAARLDKVFQPLTPVKMATLQLKEAKEASTALKTFATDLAVAIGKQTGPHLEELLAELRALRRDRATDSGEMIKDALKKFAKALSRQTGDQFDTLGRTVTNLSSVLADSARRFEETQESVGDTVKALVAEVRTSMNTSATEMSGEVRRSLVEATDAVSTALAGAGATAADNLSESSARVKEAADRLVAATAQSEQVLGHMTRFARDFDRLHSAVGDASDQIVGVASPLTEASTTIRESVTRSTAVMSRMEALVTTIERSTSRMEEHNETVKQVWSQYRKRFENVDQSLARVFEKLSGSLASYSHQVTEFAKELDATTGDAIEKLSAATGELSTTVDDLIDALPDRAS